MANLTLYHEDIYIYIDPVTEVTDTQTANNSFDFDTTLQVVDLGGSTDLTPTEQAADLGIFEIEIKAGSYKKVVISAGNKSSTFNIDLIIGDKLILDYRNLHFSKGNQLLFTDDIPVIYDNAQGNITIELTGSGVATVSRTYEYAQTNNLDLMFVESLSVDTSIERAKKVFLNNQEKTLKGEKKSHSFSINGLWSQDEISKFTDKFRLRLVDEGGNKLETLSNCRVNSDGKSSSSNGDLTFAISGSCEKLL